MGTCRFISVKWPLSTRPWIPQAAIKCSPEGSAHRAPHHRPIPDSPCDGVTAPTAWPVPTENSTTSAVGFDGPPETTVANTLDPSAVISGFAKPVLADCGMMTREDDIRSLPGAAVSSRRRPDRCRAACAGCDASDQPNASKRSPVQDRLVTSPWSEDPHTRTAPVASEMTSIWPWPALPVAIASLLPSADT